MRNPNYQVFLQIPALDYPPLLIYKELGKDLAAGRVRFVLFRYPSSGDNLNPRLTFAAHDRYYVDFMNRATRVRKIAALEELLADGKPTIVILLPLTDIEQFRRRIQPQPDRTALVPSAVYPYPVLTYNHAESKLVAICTRGK